MGKTNRFPIVGVGASAGGLDALQRLFGSMPAEGGLAFVVTTHLNPQQPSLLEQILARSTRMPVLIARDGQEVAPNHVFVLHPTRS